MKRIHLIDAYGTRLWMDDGSSLDDCSSLNETSCEHGIATTSAILRHSILPDEPRLVIPFAVNNQRFELMHPLHWVTYRVLLRDYMGWKLLTVPNSFLTQNKADAGGIHDLSDLQTHEMPIVATNIDLPPTNSWSEYLKNVYFDDETGIAYMSLWGDGGSSLSIDATQVSLATLNHIAQRNREAGCDTTNSSKSLYHDVYNVYDEGTGLSSPPPQCWIPVIMCADRVNYEDVLNKTVAHTNPPAVIIRRLLKKGEPEKIYKLNNTWVVDTFDPELFTHHVFTVSDDGKSVSNVEIFRPNITAETYKDDQWEKDTLYLRQLADEAIQNDPVVGQSSFMPLTRVNDTRRCMGGECEIGNLFLDALRWKMDADVSFCNSGGVRGPGWEAGDVRMSDVWTALPFGNTICTGVFSGINLFRLMDYSISQATFQTAYTKLGDRLLQVSGMKIVYNTQLEGSRILSIDVWDKAAGEYKPIERLRLYKFAAMSYLCFAKDPFPSLLGKDGTFTLLGEKPASNVDYGVQETVAEYLGQLDRPYQAKIEGRLVNNTNVMEPLNLVQSESSCPPDSYWDETKLTCFRCFSASNIAFSSKNETRAVQFGEDVPELVEMLLFNNDNEDVMISPKAPPYWIDLVDSNFGKLDVNGDPMLLKAGTGVAVNIRVASSKISQSGTIQGTVSFAVTSSENRPGCLGKDSSFEMIVNVAPELDMNQLGAMRYIGFSLSAIVIALSLAFGVWVWAHRHKRAFSLMQPIFLVTICAGVILLASTLIPLSIDDEIVSQEGCDIACNFIPWLLSMGFTTSFAALFSKLWRINKIMNNANAFRRVIVKVKDVLPPFVILFIINGTLLLSLTITQPLTFERYEVPTRPWDTYGECTLNGNTSKTLIALLIAVNIGAMLLTCYQAWKALHLGDGYSEAKFLGIALFSWAQILLVGVPVRVLVDADNVSARYVINIGIVFLVSASLLLIIFIPLFLSYQRSKNEDNRGSQYSGRITSLNISSQHSGGRDATHLNLSTSQYQIDTNSSNPDDNGVDNCEIDCDAQAVVENNNDQVNDPESGKHEFGSSVNESVKRCIPTSNSNSADKSNLLSKGSEEADYIVALNDSIERE